MTMTKLTDKQTAFINAYVQCLNATQAAKRAGYKCKDDNSFAVTAHGVLRNHKVRQEIDRILTSASINPVEVVGRVSKIATGSMGDFLTISENGAEIDLHKADQRGMLHLIKKLKHNRKETTQNGQTTVVETLEIQLYDAQSALDKLMRYYGLYTHKVSHSWQDDAQKAGIPPDLAKQFFDEDVSRLAELIRPTLQ